MPETFEKEWKILFVYDIIRLPHEVRVDHDHELQIHDIIIVIRPLMP